MSLFGKKKSKEIKVPACACNQNCPASEVSTMENKCSCCNESDNTICSIKVLGAGCKSCHAMYENTQKAILNMGLSVEVEYITDMSIVMQYGVMSMPALVVNEKVVAMGKVYKQEEVEKLLHKLGY